MKQKRDDRIIIAVMNHSKRCFGAVNHRVVIPWTTQTWDAAGTDPVISKGMSLDNSDIKMLFKKHLFLF